MTGIYGSSSNYMTKMARKGEFVDQIFLTMLGKKLSLLGCCFVSNVLYTSSYCDFIANCKLSHTNLIIREKWTQSEFISDIFLPARQRLMSRSFSRATATSWTLT